MNVRATIILGVLISICGGSLTMARVGIGEQLAREWTERRVAVPLAGGSGRIAFDPAFPAQARVNALFAARVSGARALEGLRQSIMGVLDGKLTPTEGAKRIRERFGEEQGAGSLLSQRQAEQTIRLQAMQAYAVGERRVALDPDVVDAFPYWRYVATKDDRTRPDHKALDGLILPKTDPFWATHTPPWEFGCRCTLVDVSAEEAARAGVAQAVTVEQADGGQTAMVVTARGQTLNILPPESGYVFRPEAAFAESDMGQIQDLKTRQAILEEMIEAAKESNQPWRFIAATEGPDAVQPPADAEQIEGSVRSLLAERRPAIDEKLVGGAKYIAGGPERTVDLGRIPQAAADGLGVKPGATRMRLSSPGSQRVGARHWSRKHAEVMADPDRALDLFRRSVWNAGSRWWVDVKTGGNVYLAAGNRAQDALTVFRREGDTWEVDMLSVFEPDNAAGSYIDKLPGRTI